MIIHIPNSSSRHGLAVFRSIADAALTLLSVLGVVIFVYFAISMCLWSVNFLVDAMNAGG